MVRHESAGRAHRRGRHADAIAVLSLIARSGLPNLGALDIRRKIRKAGFRERSRAHHARSTAPSASRIDNDRMHLAFSIDNRPAHTQIERFRPRCRKGTGRSGGREPSRCRIGARWPTARLGEHGFPRRLKATKIERLGSCTRTSREQRRDRAAV